MKVLTSQNCHTKTHVSNLMHFQEEVVHFFLKNDTLKVLKMIFTLSFNIKQNFPNKKESKIIHSIKQLIKFNIIKI